MNYISYKDAKKQGLIQLTVWLPINKEEQSFLQREYQRISADPTRICRIVKHQNRIALFVNDIARH